MRLPLGLQQAACRGAADRLQFFMDIRSDFKIWLQGQLPDVLTDERNQPLSAHEIKGSPDSVQRVDGVFSVFWNIDPFFLLGKFNPRRLYGDIVVFMLVSPYASVQS